MDRHEYWILEVSYWPHAIENGFKPIRSVMFDDRPGAYYPHEFAFAHKPTREDFIEVCNRLPWTHTWKDSLFPIIEKNDWPLVDDLHKSSSVDLFDDQKNCVGDLRVSKYHIWQNRGYNVRYVPCDIENAIVNRLPSDKRFDAQHLLLNKENWIQGQLLTSGDQSTEHLEYLIRKALFDGGLMKTKPKRKALQKASAS